MRVTTGHAPQLGVPTDVWSRRLEHLQATAVLTARRYRPPVGYDWPRADVVLVRPEP